MYLLYCQKLDERIATSLISFALYRVRAEEAGKREAGFVGKGGGGGPQPRLQRGIIIVSAFD